MYPSAGSLSELLDKLPAFVIIRPVLKKLANAVPDLDLLETILAYKFSDRALLERAITHRSWAHEQVAPGDEMHARKLHNESLEFLRFGRGEEKSGGRQKNALLADVFEAITGAVFVDGGLEAATEFLCHALSEELEGADPLSAAKADYKTMLQEKLQAERRQAPRYIVIETLGPPHRRIFHVEVSWDDGSIQGEGHSIKAAEASAARAALEVMASNL